MISNRARGVADDKRVRIVIEEDHQAHQPNGYLATDGGLRPANNDSHDTRHAAIARNDANHAANHHREHDDCGVVRVSKRIDDENRKNIHEPLQCAERREALQCRCAKPQSEH